MAAGPGAGEVPSVAQTQQAFEMDPRGADAFSALNPNVQQRLEQAYAQSPSFAQKNPWALTGLANQEHVPAQSIPGIIKYLTAYQQVGGLAKYEGQQNPTKPSTNFFGSMINGVRHMWDKSANFIDKHGVLGSAETIVGDVGNVLSRTFKPEATSLNQQVSSLTTGGQIQAPDITAETTKKVMSTAEGAYKGGKDLVKFGQTLAQRTLGTAVEVLTGGRYNPFTNQWDWHWNWGSLDDAYHTVSNVIEDVANPFSKNNIFFGSQNNIFLMMAHNWAFYESMAARYGWAYTLGYMTPAMAMGIATDGAFLGANGAELTTEEMITSRVEQAIANGEKISPALRAQYERIMAKAKAAEGEGAPAEGVPTEGVPTEEPTAPKPQESQTLLKQSAARKLGDRTFQYATAPLRSIFRVARYASKPMSSLKYNTVYLATAQMAQRDPALAKLWKETADGVAVDAYGRKMGTSGQMLAQYFGIDKGNMFFSPVSGLTDFYQKFIGTDPLGAYGDVIGKARSFGGFTGKMGNWFGGLGVRGADDVFRSYTQYRRVRNAVRYMANHTSAEIIDAFRNTFTDGIRNIKDTKSIIVQLGEAQTEEEVLKILADVGEAYGFTRNMMPTLSMYEVMKAGLRGSIRTIAPDVGNFLNSDGKVVEKWSAMVKDQTGLEIKPTTGTEYAADENTLGKSGAFIRGTVTFARWMSTRLTRSAMYIDELTSAVENHIIRPGSINAIPAVMDYLRAALMPENLVRSVGDLLLNAKTREEYFNVYRHAMYHSVMRRAIAGMDDARAALMTEKVSEHVWQEVVRLTSVDGGGERGAYIAGVHGFDLAQVVDSSRDFTKMAGIGETHLGNLRFARTAELKGLAKRVKEIVNEVVDTVPGQNFVAGMNKEDEVLSRIVEWNQPEVATFFKQIEEGAHREEGFVAPTLVGEDAASVHQTAGTFGYENANKEIADLLHAVKTDATVPQQTQFVRFAQQVWRKASDTSKTLTALGEASLLIKASPAITQYGDRLINLVGSAPQYQEFAQRWGELTAMMPDLNYNNIDEKIAEYKGRTVALQEISTRLNEVVTKNKDAFENSIKTERDFKKLKKDLRKSARAVDEELKYRYNELYEKYAKKGANRQYIVGPQVGIDLINRFLSRTFVPIALTSGGWAIRVGASEGILNTFRNGFWPTFDARVARSIAKHEIAGDAYISARALKTGAAAQEDELVNKIEKDSLDFLRNPETGLFVFPKHVGEQALRIEGGMDLAKAQTDLAAKLKEYGTEVKVADEASKQVLEFINTVGSPMLHDTRILMTQLPKETMGDYVRGLVTIYKEALESSEGPAPTIVHELWHHLANYLSPETKMEMEADLENARKELFNSPRFQNWIQGHINFLNEIGNTDFAFRLEDAYMEYVQNGDINYFFNSSSEFKQKIFSEYAYYLRKTTRYLGAETPENQWRDLYRLFNVEEWFAIEGEKAFLNKEEPKRGIFQWVRNVLRSLFRHHAEIHGSTATEKTIKQFMAKQYAPADSSLTMKLWNRHDANAAFNAGMGGKETQQEREIHDIINNPSMHSEVRNIRNIVARAIHRLSMPDTYKEFFGGAMAGLQKNIMDSMNEAERQRMLDHMISTITRYKGQLPGAVHSASGTIFNDQTIDHAAANIVVGEDGLGNPVQSHAFRTPEYQHISAGSPGYITALTENLGRIINDGLMAPAAQVLHQAIMEEGMREVIARASDYSQGVIDLNKLTSYEILKLGAQKFQTVDQVDALQRTVEAEAYKSIMALPEDQRASFERSTARIKPNIAEGKLSRATAEEEWAATIAYHLINSVSGEGARGRVFHELLVEPLGSHQMPADEELAKGIRSWRRRGDSSPKYIPTQGFTETDPFRAGSWADLPRAINEWSHEKVLGPIVNRLVREHTFLYEQHVEMEKFEPLIEQGIISRESAEMIADRNALINMTRFIHNPKDKSLFEENMRIFAPFYFAQNQAWRRAMRVFRENPGAFEKYMKLCLGITSYVGRGTQGGQTPTLSIPGMTLPGYLGGIGATLPVVGGGLARSPFANLSFGLSADPGSVSSIVPTGSETGLSGFLGLFRPSWGPVVTIPIKLADKIFGISHHELGRKWVNSMLGPISSNSSMWSDIFPSTIGRNAFDLGTALFGIIPGTNIHTSDLDSAENYAINNAFDNLMISRINYVINQTDFSGVNSWTGKAWTHDEIVAYARSQADSWVAKKFQDPQYAQEFLDRAKAAAVMMTLVRTVVSLGSPVAVTLQEQFSKMPEFQKILSSINPVTNQKYTFEEAANEFAVKYPGNLMDLTAHSASPYTPYPETVSAVNLLTNHPEVAAMYPNAAAYLIDRNTAYSPAAYQLELSLDLRQREVPQQYLNSLLIAAGNDYYYNFMEVQPQFGGTGDAAGKNTTYDQYKQLTAAAKQYGRTDNPTWYEVFVGQKKQSIEIQALSEMRQLLGNNSINVMSATEKSNFQYLIEQYDKTVKTVNELKAAGDGSTASIIENSWYNEITQAALEPQWAKESYFMTGVLRGLPTKN